MRWIQKVVWVIKNLDEGIFQRPITRHLNSSLQLAETVFLLHNDHFVSALTGSFAFVRSAAFAVTKNRRGYKQAGEWSCCEN